MPVTYSSSMRDASPLMRIFLGRVLPVFFVIGGLVLGSIGVQQVLQAKASEDWPTVEGRVLESHVESRKSRDADSHGTVYEAEVLFEYSVEGTTYKGNRVMSSSFATDRPNRAQKVVNRYPVGTTVEVYYMPGDPAESLLEPGITIGSAIMPAMAASSLFVGILMAVLFSRASKNAGREKVARSSEERPPETSVGSSAG